MKRGKCCICGKKRLAKFLIPEMWIYSEYPKKITRLPVNVCKQTEKNKICSFTFLQLIESPFRADILK